MKSAVLTSALLGATFVAGAVQADIIVADRSPYSYSDSGEITAYTSPNGYLGNYASSAIVNGGFETFAADDNHFFTYGQPYNYTLSQTDVDGHQLTVGAAYLYYQFSQGDLTGYTYDVTDPYDRTQDAGELQAALWALEGYSAPSSVWPSGTTGNAFYQQAVDQFGSSGAFAANDGTYNVDIMDLSDQNGDPVQNMFVVPGSPVSAPDGTMTWAMLAGGVVMLMLWGRQQRRFPAVVRV